MIEEIPELPFTRILVRGPGALTDAEVLAVLLRKQRSEEATAREKAESLLAHFGCLSGVADCTSQMAGIHKLNDRQTANLLAALELARRLHARPKKVNLAGSAVAVVNYLTLFFDRPSQQILGALFLGHNQDVLGIAEVFRGGATAIRMDTKTILREALCREAAGFSVFHIFPEAKAQINDEIGKFGKQLAEAAELVGLELFDYLLIGGDNWISLRQKKPW